MIKRYSDPRIIDTWSLENKFRLWQTVELAVIQARENLCRIPQGTSAKIKEILEGSKIDISFIDEREKVLQHDLNAFLEERSRFLPKELQVEFHKKMTSYDTEEAPFAIMLQQSCNYVVKDAEILLGKIREQAIKYRFTPMNARTHGQEAEMQSFGKRCLTWYVDLRTALEQLKLQMDRLCYSKLSGAIGSNSGIEPDLELVALEILGFQPWVGATQIIPRVLYSPIAGALADLAVVTDKIANDIRLGARSGRPLWHEPFGKKQKGSSAMPHKKNTIHGENTEGMAQMARHYCAGIQENIKTWEERAIAQSSVERVFWPDLFHVSIRAIKNLTKVLSGLVVYPDNMMVEIVESRGCYASNEAKEKLLELGSSSGLTREVSYRIIQLACFNVFEPREMVIRSLRESPPEKPNDSDKLLEIIRSVMIGRNMEEHLSSIKDVILSGSLHISFQLDADQETIDGWNQLLKQIFDPKNSENIVQWELIFKPSHILSNESYQFQQVFGI